MKYRVLIVDDDQLLTASLESVLKHCGYDVSVCSHGTKALPMINDVQPDVVLLDIYLGDTNGIEILKSIKSNDATLPVVMITAYSDVKLAVEAMKLGSEDFVVKPLDIDQLEVILSKALRTVHLQREVNRLKNEIDDQTHSKEIIGSSPAIKSTLKLAERFAQSEDTTVLIEGESGVGKELFARYIHRASLRAEGPFVSVNCGAIPKELAESEFFGYEKGAFTGATERMKQGKFELAHGGIIFLDEISDLSLEMQVKLLRVLQDKKFFRLGGSKEIVVDTRVIAATNRDLWKEVERAAFREDLFYRLNVAAFKIPPLRERREDIVLLVNSFIEEFNKKFSRRVHGITREAMEIIENNPWKGNVRELRNVLERVVLVEADNVIQPQHLRFLRHDESEMTEKTSISNKEFALTIPPTGISMSKVLKALILKTLEITGGNQVKAAKVLGLTRSKLRYRMEQLGIQTQPKTYASNEE
ncbi:MAG: sigma-54 dependent transcriptional regulator [Bacteroidota bacterium]